MHIEHYTAPKLNLIPLILDHRLTPIFFFLISSCYTLFVDMVISIKSWIQFDSIVFPSHDKPNKFFFIFCFVLFLFVILLLIFNTDSILFVLLGCWQCSPWESVSPWVWNFNWIWCSFKHCKGSIRNNFFI